MTTAFGKLVIGLMLCTVPALAAGRCECECVRKGEKLCPKGNEYYEGTVGHYRCEPGWKTKVDAADEAACKATSDACEGKIFDGHKLRKKLKGKLANCEMK